MSGPAIRGALRQRGGDVAFKLIDLTGKPFGRLTVIKRADANSPTGEPLWVCRCCCGVTGFEVRGCALRNGNTKSCGCLKRERWGRARRKRIRASRSHGDEVADFLAND